jgi:hypothetical protein
LELYVVGNSDDHQPDLVSAVSFLFSRPYSQETGALYFQRRGNGINIKEKMDLYGPGLGFYHVVDNVRRTRVERYGGRTASGLDACGDRDSHMGMLRRHVRIFHAVLFDEKTIRPMTPRGPII